MPEDEIVSASDLVTICKIAADLSDKDAIKSAEEAEESKSAIRAYKKRWLMLLLYAFFSALVASQWVQYSVISGIITRYYGVTAFEVDCTRMVFVLSYVLTVLPVSQASERIGLKWTLVLGSALCCAGAWIKTFSVATDRFYVTMIGQTVVSWSAVILQTTPSRVAASWFPAGELSTATALGLVGAQLGSVLTHLLTPVTVLNQDTLDELSDDLASMYKKTAFAATLNLMLVAILFQQEPERHSANEARALQRVNEADKKSDGEKVESSGEPFKRLFTNRSFLLLCSSHGLNAGCLAALGALMRRLFELRFEDSERDASKANLFLILTGVVGLIMIGVILDKTRKFKETAVKVYFCILCGQVAFAVAMLAELKSVVFIVAIFLGFCMTGCTALSYELAAELTYPEAESHVAGVLNIGANFFAATMIVALDWLLQTGFGDLAVHALLCGAAFAGFMLTTMLAGERRRQDALGAAVECDDDELPKVIVAGEV